MWKSIVGVLVLLAVISAASGFPWWLIPGYVAVFGGAAWLLERWLGGPPKTRGGRR